MLHSKLMLLALVLVVGGALYIRWRWARSPQAYGAVIGLAICYFAAGSVAAMSLMLATKQNAEPVASAIPAPVALPSLNSEAPVPAIAPMPSFVYDPARAARPDPRLTPGDVIKDASKDDVCTPGWAREHRHVTDSDRARVYAEYTDSQRTCRCMDGYPGGCCEVDHLIPLELGGSNDIRNLWPQPDMPKPGDGEKDQLENTLHDLVCKGAMPLADAQNCIASDWPKCWATYVAPLYGAEWAAANRRGW